jgi:hypothetical protein
MSASTKDKKIKQYNVTILELIKLILSLNEEHQEATFSPPFRPPENHAKYR